MNKWGVILTDETFDFGQTFTLSPNDRAVFGNLTIYFAFWVKGSYAPNPFDPNDMGGSFVAWHILLSDDKEKFAAYRQLSFEEQLAKRRDSDNFKSIVFSSSNPRDFVEWKDYRIYALDFFKLKVTKKSNE